MQRPTLAANFDVLSEIQRLAKPVLDDGHHVLGLASDSCVWPGISPPLAVFLAGLEAPAVVISSLKSTSPVVPSSTTNPCIPRVAQILSTLLGADWEDYISEAVLQSDHVTDESQSVDPPHAAAPVLAHTFKQLGGGGRHIKFDSAVLAKLVYDDHGLDVAASLTRKHSFVAVDVPFDILVPGLTRTEMTYVAQQHNILLPSRLNVQRAKELLSKHSCDKCRKLLCVMDIVMPALPPKHTRLPAAVSKNNANTYARRKKKHLVEPSAAQLHNIAATVSAQAKAYRHARNMQDNSQEDDLSPLQEFPPPPPSMKDLHRILTNSVLAVQPEQFVEAGCAVCGKLSPLSKLTPMADFKPSLAVLNKAGVTRKERFSAGEAIEDREGPILAEGCTHFRSLRWQITVGWDLSHHSYKV
ncbi:hypothetical protein K438DRAFT_1961541 [Mycena galopus ATCC 62051]|nr:hypothetical protein K438DRAFT_1961541 [Mycena galopus ATCC 62051]